MGHGITWTSQLVVILLKRTTHGQEIHNQVNKHLEISKSYSLLYTNHDHRHKKDLSTT